MINVKNPFEGGLAERRCVRQLMAICDALEIDHIETGTTATSPCPVYNRRGEVIGYVDRAVARVWTIQQSKPMTDVRVYESKSGLYLGRGEMLDERWAEYEQHCERHAEGHVRLDEWLPDDGRANVNAQDDTSVWMEKIVLP